MRNYLKNTSLFQFGSWKVLFVTLLVNVSTFKLGFGLGFTSPTSHQLLHSGILSHYTFPIFSSIYALGVAVGCGCVVPLLGLFGRKSLIIFSSLISTSAWLLIASTSSPITLISGRVFAGISAGVCFTAVPLYTGEVAHHRVKGFFAGFFGLSLRLGTLTSYILGIFVSFRWLALAPVFLDIIHVPILTVVCSSPTWLISRHLYSRGRAALLRLGRSEADARQECDEVEEVMTDREARGRGLRKSVLLLFQKYNFKALTVGLAYMLFEPLTGTDVIDAYASTILSENDFQLIDPNSASLFFPLFAITANVMLLFVIDRIGRKTLTIISGSGIILCLFSMSLYVYTTHTIDNAYFHNSTWHHEYVSIWPLINLAGVRFLHGLGWGSVGFILLGELFPAKVKSILAGISSVGSWVVIFLVLLLFPYLSNLIGYGATFAILGTINIGSILFVILFLPETKKLSVKEIERLFEERTIFCGCSRKKNESRTGEIELQLIAMQ